MPLRSNAMRSARPVSDRRLISGLGEGGFSGFIGFVQVDAPQGAAIHAPNFAILRASHRVVKHQSERPAGLMPFSRDSFASEQSAADCRIRSGPDLAGQQFEKRAFSRTVRAEDCDAFPMAEGEGEIPQRERFAPPPPCVPDLEMSFVIRGITRYGR